MRKGIAKVFLMMLGLALLAISGFAQAPNSIIYQGRLTNADGDPITSQVSVTFTIWSAASGGTNLYNSTIALTPDNNGIFTVELSGVDNSDLDGNKRYLGIKVGTDPEMTPRQLLTSVPYAYSVRNAPGIARVSGSSGGTIPTTEDDLIADSVTISIPGPGYVSLNANGYVTLSGSTVGNALVTVKKTKVSGSPYVAIGYSDNAVATSLLEWKCFNFNEVFYESSPGAKKYYLIFWRGWNAGSASVSTYSMTATYFPASYGTVEVTSMTNGDNGQPVAIDDRDVDPNSETQTVYKVDLSKNSQDK